MAESSSTSDSSPILLIEELESEIGGRKILNGVSLSVNRGESVGVIGPNGSGKTTFFNCISGFAPATGGTISLMGSDVTSLPPFKRSRRGIGRVFQNCGVFREMSVLENIIIAIESKQSILSTFLPWSPLNRKNRDAAMEYLRQVNLVEKASDRAGSLSGGQLRLLEIIRTLAFGAELFLLDEPTAGVSPRMKEQLAELICSLHQMKKTILVIEHDINFIEKLADRVAVLDSGKVILDGTPTYVRSHPTLQEIYFGTGKTKDTLPKLEVAL